ncbi:MAG: hypothetical protein Q8N39_00475 [Pelolinea sp.]|nr:hypothetical protein [Pelolinea sp.]
MLEENIKAIKEKKKWQPINILLGLLIISLVFYAIQSQSLNLPPLLFAFLRIIPALILIFTKRNNCFSFLFLLIFGLTVFFITTIDGFVIIGSAMYMFLSTVLRMFKVKKYAVIGLAFSLIFGLGLSWEYASTFISDRNLTITRKMNAETSIELVGDTGEISTNFHFNRGISPRGKGLKKGTYVYQVVSKSKGMSVPLTKWPVIIIKANGDVIQRGLVVNWLDLKDVALHGTFNLDKRFPLGLGDYSIMLIKIEKNEGVIVAESNFSIVPYDEQIYSKLTAYLTVDGDPNKYSDSYTKKEGDSVSVSAWVQSTSGEEISGILKFFMANSNGDIEKTSWVGVSETAFKTNPDGTPTKLRNLSGNPLPGIYHFQIVIDGNVVYDLKYTV